ncbi:unnamed protein product [Protopolystoma xenopodis]|uniref:Uncharacterized protein n=1 Tax=Protopolystoma xenopodis TaxID=117903 RepID=A0A448WKW8_9PLAT|nr:unnamed protein product [Protopolystoma xenopodis]
MVLHAGPGLPSPGISHLGIRPYNWRAECLHGMGRGEPATAFPMAINLAASFSQATMEAVAFATGLEARAIRNANVDRGNYSVRCGFSNKE